MKRILYQDASEAFTESKINKLSAFIKPVRDSDSCMTALDRFFEDKNLFAVPVIDQDNRPVGLIERHHFVEFFGKPFTREIHSKKTVGTMLAPVVNMNPIVVGFLTTVDDVAQIIIDAGMEHMVSGVIVSNDGEYAGVVNGHDLLNEITQRRQAELYALAHHDALTGLPNRRLFLDRVNQACRDVKRTALLVAVMFIDVDRFKLINDSLGHAAGDHLLKAVADRLQQCARDCDTVARLGGDEFGIIMERIPSRLDSETIASRIIESMKNPFVIAEREFFVTVSIGIAIFPQDDFAVSGLLNKADAAMYGVKANGRNGFKYFVPGLASEALDSLSIETELRNGIARDELVLHYQPLVDLNTGHVNGVEALVRWHHPERGLLSPAHFIPIAEQSHLIVDLGYWVLRAACQQFTVWVESGCPPLKISVNVSTRQFQELGFCAGVRRVIEETGMNTAFLEIELTESIMMHHGRHALETLNELKAMGISLALDDFGTGFSSLSYLRQYPIDRLKIDQSFVRMIENSSSSESIVRAISALGKSMSMEVVAEGVETEIELGVVTDCRCDKVQGYFFSKPIPATELMQWLKENPRYSEFPLMQTLGIDAHIHPVISSLGLS
ncbi:LOG family protein [Sulfuricella sp. T08]|uniref:EAL domain-containing protein n=1 Tax=Sulfuricella sp. T08 TaxID=1632857 RepID=UPI0006179BC8|nr:EAL domain-containing protein [Sulfuricella sp. T08]GAO36445.1 LOG family protein [Sulfuricella sp. T08]